MFMTPSYIYIYMYVHIYISVKSSIGAIDGIEVHDIRYGVFFSEFQCQVKLDTNGLA